MRADFPAIEEPTERLGHYHSGREHGVDVVAKAHAYPTSADQAAPPSSVHTTA